MGFAGGGGVGVKSALTPTLSRKRERGLFGVAGNSRVILKQLTSPRHSRECGNPVTGGSRASSLLRKAKAKAKARLLLGFPEKYPSTPECPFRRPSETGAQEVMRHGCRESPVGYRDVSSGRASVAGEFARVARLHRARMRGKPFWFLFAGVAFHRLTKGTRPRGRNKKSPQTRCGALHPNKTSLGSRVRGNDGGEVGCEGPSPASKQIHTPIPNEKCRFSQGKKRHSFESPTTPAGLSSRRKA